MSFGFTPRDWRRATLGACCDIISGGTPRRERPEYWGGTIPWVTPKDISDLDDPVLMDPPEHISELGLRNSSATIVPAGTILLSSRAPIGLVAIAGQPMATNQGFKSLVPGADLDSRFLYHSIKRMVPVIASKGNGATFKEVSKAVVEDIEVSFPSTIDEQKRIAAILDKADAICRKRRQALAEIDALLRATFLDMFGDPRTNPKNYDVVPLQKLADVTVGHPFESRKFTDHGIRLCRGANVLPYRLDWEDVRYWREDDCEQFAELKLQELDVILALDRPMISGGLKIAQARASDLPALLVQRVARIRAADRHLQSYLYYALAHPAFWRYCRPTETTIPHISPVELKRYPIANPCPMVLKKFAATIEQLGLFAERARSALGESQSLFASLSQRAFRGEL